MKFPLKTRRGLDPMLAMINVVFLLLAFFMLGNFEEPKPASLELPKAKGQDAPAGAVIFISQDGDFEFEGLTGEAALNEAKQRAELRVAADARLKANELIALLNTLRREGVVIDGIEVAE